MRARLCLGRGGRVAALAAVYAGGGGAALACGELFSSGAPSDAPDADLAGDASDGSDGPDADAARPPCDLDAAFGEAVLIDVPDGDGGTINEGGASYGAWLSDDELTIFFTRALQIPGPALYMATRTSPDAPFDAATAVSITPDSPSPAAWPSLPSSRALLYFVALAGSDGHIFVAKRADGGFSDRVLLDAGADALAETTPSVSRDGSELFFALWSGLAPPRIFRAKLQNGMPAAATGPVEVLPGEADAAAMAPVPSADGRTLYFARRPLPGAAKPYEVWSATRAPDGGGAFAPSQPVSWQGDASGQDELPNWISPDGCRLYFQRGAFWTQPLTARIYVASKPAR